MDFAADAVLDVVTPPMRSTPTRAPAADAGDGPTFEDHLEAATQEDAPVENTAAPAAPEQTQVSGTDELLGGPEGPPVSAPAPQPEQPAAPVVVQLIAAAAPAPQAQTQQSASPTEAAAVAPASAPSTPAPTNDAAAPMQSAPAAGGKSAAPAHADATAEQTAPAPTQQSAPQEKSAAQQPAAPQTAAPQQATSAQPALAPTVASSPAAAESTATPPVVSAPAQAPATSEAARHAKSAPARGDAKSDASAVVDQAAPTSTPTAAPRTAGKAAQPHNAAKDAVAIQTLDAPEAQQPQAQQASATPATGASSQAHQAETEQAAVRALPAAQQVAREIVRRFEGGNTRFELRLDPPELGRVEVRLDVSRDHRVTAVIAADSPQALTELARHARELEQMLQGAGLELSDSGLSFDLRQGGERAETAEFRGASFDGAALNEEQTQVTARPLGYERWRGVRVDVMV